MIPALLFGLALGILGNALYTAVIGSDSAEVSQRNNLTLFITAIILILLYGGVLQALSKLRNRQVNDPARGLIIMMRYLPEARASLAHLDKKLERAYVLVPDATGSRANAKVAQEGLAKDIARLKHTDKVMFEPIANVNQAHLSVGKVGECLSKLRQLGIRPSEVVLDVTDVPGHVLVDLIQAFGGMVQSFQMVPKALRPEVAGLEDHRPTDDDFIAGRPFRFRATDILLEVAPDGP